MPVPAYEYSWDFSTGPGAWTSWFAPSVVQDPGGSVSAFTRFHAPGNVDPNHIDGIGSLFLLAHLSIPTVGSAGVLNLADAEFEITIKGTAFETQPLALSGATFDADPLVLPPSGDDFVALPKGQDGPQVLPGLIDEFEIVSDPGVRWTRGDGPSALVDPLVVMGPHGLHLLQADDLHGPASQDDWL